ncbi:hypothetical protein RCL1_002962 [Eukaryota sp. TZLM3-RCL]
MLDTTTSLTLCNRYSLYEDFSSEVSIVNAIDKKAITPHNRSVVIKLITSELVYNAQVKLYSKLRSKFVANMVDHFHDSERNLFFIVLERGGFSLKDKLLESKPVCSTSTYKQLASIWLYLYSHKCSLSTFNPSDFFYYKHSQWKLVNLDSVVSSLESNDFVCDLKVCEDLVGSNSSLNFNETITLPLLLIKCCLLSHSKLSTEERTRCLELLLVVVASPCLKLVDDCKNPQTQELFRLLAILVEQ